MTPTPQAGMSRRVYADKEKSELVCGDGAAHRKCELPEGGAPSASMSSPKCRLPADTQPTLWSFNVPDDLLGVATQFGSDCG